MSFDHFPRWRSIPMDALTCIGSLNVSQPCDRQKWICKERQRESDDIDRHDCAKLPKPA
jgi:hypothetical protein